MRARLLLALLASLTVVLGAPYVGQIRASIQTALPGQYRNIVGGIVIAAVAAAVVTALARIRERRLLRYGALVAAVGGGVIYAGLTATGNADVDVVERFHFVEYGVLTWLFYRAWRAQGDVTALVFPILAGITVGILDEGFQWLIPARVGELHDVLLNGAAIACGLTFSLGLDPPARATVLPDRNGRRALAVFAAMTIVTLALFVHAVHLGHEIRDSDLGTFRSRYSADDLTAASVDRAVRWRAEPPRGLRRVSMEDHYLAEGIWHIQRRNEGDAWTAWKENLILEHYFDPVLAFPTYSTPSGARWPPEQRANTAARVGGDPRSYVSTANPYPIYLWSATAFWAGVGGLLALVALAGVVPGR
ncbi:MAG TPA: VanZ family protein [Vicinamibacterales bacterium]|nr:VanZ family protein [Vicinamibacterales bacterium]